MEYWDLYDYKRKKKNKTAIRGSKLHDNDFHLVVNAWIINDKGEYLITQRVATKSHPLMWECTGGSALKGEKSIDAAIREVKEELGIDVSKSDATLIGTTRRFYKNCPDILDVWVFHKNIDLKDVVVQEEEVNDVMWASKDKINELFEQGKFEANAFFNKVIDTGEKFYYVGFNANNAICNTQFFDGEITLNPNKEKGNIFYTKKYIASKNEEFLSDYKTYLLNTMDMLTENNKNISFLVFNKGIYELLKNETKYKIITNNFELINSLNDKKDIRSKLNKCLPVINSIWIDSEISYEKAKEIVKSNKFVIQGREGSGGNNTYFIDSKNKFNKYSKECNNNYLISKFVEHLPINTTAIIGEYNDVILPNSVQLIELKDDKFKYVGADFIYYQTLSEDIKTKIDNTTKEILNLLKNKGYRGIVGIDYILDEFDNLYFMEFNPRFQSSTFIISEYLTKYCYTSVAQLHYLGIQKKYIGNTYLDKIDNSFVNCFEENDYNEFTNPRLVKYGYYKKNKSSCFRKVFDYSILKQGNFQKRKKD